MSEQRICGIHEYIFHTEDDSFSLSAGISHQECGIDILWFCLDAPYLSKLPRLTIRWQRPIIDMIACWTPAGKSQLGDNESCATYSAPVSCLYGGNNRNRETWALSDAMPVIRSHIGLRVDYGIQANDSIELTLFSAPSDLAAHYEALLRIDTRDIPYEQALESVSKWWETFPEYGHSMIPDACLHPHYSTWYSFVQDPDAARVEKQAALARQIGCHSIIVDDGWQMDADFDYYAHCGDWKPSAVKFPDMKAHVAKIHDMGMKYLLWYAVPLCGNDSRLIKVFGDKLLRTWPELKTNYLDPRYPDVREYLINTFEKAVMDWQVDGLKLDFVDGFRQPRQELNPNDPRRDFESVPAAADKLLSDTLARLRILNPDIMIEFRQPYIGPVMRRYCNMIRAGDCPNSASLNKNRIADLRLLFSGASIHSDMLMWNPEDSIESVGCFLVSIIFSVPQISMLLDQIPQEHLDVLKFWLAIWEKYRSSLVLGEFRACYPELQYPMLTGWKDDEFSAAVFCDIPVPIPSDKKRILIANGGSRHRVLIEADGQYSPCRLIIYHSTGKILFDDQHVFKKGINDLDIPIGGAAELIF